MARGSENKLGAFPNLCHGCRQPIRFSATTLPLWFETDCVTWELRSWHCVCHPAYPRDSVAWREAA